MTSIRLCSIGAVAAGLLSVLGSAQTTTSSASGGDGLTTTAASQTQSYVTVVNNNITQTYRAIPTLDSSIGDTPPLLPNVFDPQAIDAQTVCPGYTGSNVQTTDSGLTATLTLAGAACNAYGTDIESLALSVEYQSNDRLAIKITPTYIDESNATQYVVQPYYVAEPSAETGSTVDTSDFEFYWRNDAQTGFGFQVIRRSSSDVLFDSIGSVLVFENQFVEFKSYLPPEYNLYGLGERIHSLRLGNDFVATMYAADTGDPIDYNLYGVHPFYLDTRYYEVNQETGRRTLVTTAAVDAITDYASESHGVYYRNAHPHEVVLNTTSITWRTLGGSIELYFFNGPSQPEVTAQYNTVIGLPAMQQYWTFGYHQCRWGYTNWTELQDVVDNMRNFNIPMETIWTDIDYMNQYRDFDNDQNTFSYPEAATFLGALHAGGQHYVPIVDSAIYIPNPLNASDAYGTYTRGNASNAFINAWDGTQYIGDVWPGFTVFPDWRAQGTQDWWTGEMTGWHSNVSFDGIWIDMSEVSSFCIGSCGTGRVTENPVHPPFQLPGETNNVIYSYPEGFAVSNKSEWASVLSASSAQASRISATHTSPPNTATTPYLRTTPTPGIRNVTYPPYVIKNANGALGGHALSPDAVHADGTQDYDIHSLYGAEIINATYNALLDVFPGKRPFIIGRSNFAGSGHLAGHWGGDNAAEWYYMYYSIPQALSHSLFGIPMFGVDTCGFNGNTDEELCNRWMQLSAFFPFYRNHNVLSAISQEPYRWASVAKATKTAMAIRYALLPYMYTLFHGANTAGSTVMRALSWEFPNDPTLAAADHQFLLGPSIMVIPCLTPLARTVSGVFPGVKVNEKWYNWYTQVAVHAKPGENKTLNAPLGHIPVFVRGGAVLPMQEPGYTTTESRTNDWALLVALTNAYTATGSLYLDDGESLVQTATKDVALSVSGGTLTANVTGSYEQSQPLANVTILGMRNSPQVGVTLNGANVTSWQYSKAKNVLYITGLQEMTSSGAWAASWSLSWS